MAHIYYELPEDQLKDYRYRVETRFNTFYCVSYEWQPQNHTLTLFEVVEILIHGIDQSKVYEKYPHVTILGGQIIIKPVSWEKKGAK